jgi:purine-cytosine permease-like protein
MRPQALKAPGEWLFALLMAASPIIGAIWVKPDPTKWSVFGVGVAMVVGVIIAGLWPTRIRPR